jgi:hypothetical protein
MGDQTETGLLRGSTGGTVTSWSHSASFLIFIEHIF